MSRVKITRSLALIVANNKDVQEKNASDSSNYAVSWGHKG